MIRFLLSTCLITLLCSCDPKESFYSHSFKIVFENNTDTELILTDYALASNEPDTGYTAYTTSVVLAANNKNSFSAYNYAITFDIDEGYDSITMIQETVECFYSSKHSYGKLDLFIEDSLIKTWEPPIGYFGDTLNSPYNYDSWKFVEYEEVVAESNRDFILGEIIFTITQEDLQ